jgi:two-component system, LytTR family, response regulator
MQHSSLFFEQSSFKKKYVLFSLTIFFAVIILAIIQDYLHSYFNNYSFYLSESLLFKSYWLLFIPVIYLQLFIIKKYRNKLFGKLNLLAILSVTTICSLLHIFMFATVVKIGSALFFNHTYGFSQTVNYTIADDFYKYILIYGILAFVSTRASIKNKKEERQIPETNIFLSKISIGTGKNYTAVNVQDIFFISTANPYITINTTVGKFLHGETLKSITQKLDGKQFIRVHKSSIVNIKKVVSYKSRLNGDYDITLQNGEVVRMSRNFADLFKEQFI